MLHWKIVKKDDWVQFSQSLYILSLYILGEIDSENRAEFSNTRKRLAEISRNILLRLKVCDIQQRQQQFQPLYFYSFLIVVEKLSCQWSMDPKLVLFSTWYYLPKYWKSLKQWKSEMLNTHYSPYKINEILKK